MDFPTFNLNRFYSLRNKDGCTLNLSAFNGQRNKDSTAFETDYTICLVKDDKAMYSIELSGHGTSAKFNISASQHISDGSNSTTKEMRSHEGVIELITVLDKYIPIADIVSSYRVSKPNTNKPAEKDPFNKQQSSGVSTVDDDNLLF